MNNQLIRTYLALIIITLGAMWIAQRAGIAVPVYTTSSNRSSEFIVNDEGSVDANQIRLR